VRRRILVAILGVTGVAIVLFGAPLAIVLGRLVNEDATLRLERHAILAARTVPADFATNADPVELPENVDGVTFALYDRGGRLVVGDGPRSADEVTLQALSDQVTDSEAAGVRIVAVPVAADEQVVGAIRAEQSTAPAVARYRRFLLSLSALAFIVLIIGAAIGYVVAGRLARPVRRLRDAAVQLGNGDFAVDASHSNIPELDEAEQALVTTARRLEELVSRERMFSADVSHQLRTPLAGLRAGIETEMAFPRPDPTEVLREALVDLDRLERTVSELLTIARTPVADDSRASLGAVLNDIESRWAVPFSDAGRRLVVSPARLTAEVRGTDAMLRHVLDVLIDNGLQHGDGELRIGHTVGVDTVTVTITDEGPGFAGQPFTITDRSGGSGQAPIESLGLPLAKRLIESMSGRIMVTRMGPHPQIDVVLQRADVPRR